MCCRLSGKARHRTQQTGSALAGNIWRHINQSFCGIRRGTTTERSGELGNVGPVIIRRCQLPSFGRIRRTH